MVERDAAETLKRTGSWDRFRWPGLFVLITLAGFVVAYQFVKPAPPRRFVLATGHPDGAYHAFGQQYREILARKGVEVELRSTAGSIENIRLLESREGGVEAAFVQGGTGDPEASRALVSLGSLYFEPLWVFTRAGSIPDRLADLRGKRIAVGREGSGTRAVALQLLGENGVAGPPTLLTDVGGREAREALRGGRVDAAFLIASPRAPMVRELLEDPGLGLMSFRRAAAYRMRLRYLAALTLPEGAIDLERNLPPRDTVLLAPAAALVVREDIHPALSGLLLQAAREVHREGGAFEEPGRFPSPRYVDFPLSREAARFYASGPPLLQRFLPFWAATLIDRFQVMLLPLVTLLLPLFKVVPPTYKWRVRSKIYKPYKELLRVTERVHADEAGRDSREHLEALRRIEDEVNRISVPLAYSDALFSLRHHIDVVRARVLGKEGGAGVPPAGS